MLDVYTVEVRQHPWEAEIKSQAQWNFDADKQAEDLNPADRKKAKVAAAKRVDLRSDDATVLLKPRSGETPGHTAFLTFCRKKI